MRLSFPAFMDGAAALNYVDVYQEGSGTSAYRASENAWRVGEIEKISYK